MRSWPCSARARLPPSIAAGPMEFGLAHGVQDAEQQAVGVLRWIVDAVFVDDQGVGQGADFQEAIPIAAGASQPRRLQAEDGSGLAQADLRDEELKAVPILRRRTGMPLVLIDDGNGRLRPTQVLGTQSEIVLPRCWRCVREPGRKWIDGRKRRPGVQDGRDES